MRGHLGSCVARGRELACTEPLALLAVIAHPQKWFLKIAPSQGSTSVIRWPSGHVAVPAAIRLERGQQRTASPGPPPKKNKSFHGSLAPALLLLPAGCGRRPRASVCSELVVVSSTPPPRFKASGAGRAPHVRAPGYFYLLPPQLQRSPFSEVAHASSAQGINENSSRGGELLRGGGGGNPRRTPGTQGRGRSSWGSRGGE